MSLILPANSLTGGYEIDNSLRFNDGSSDYLEKVKTGSNGNLKIWTFSTWVKRSQLGTVQTIFSFGENLSAEGQLQFDANDFLTLINDNQNGSTNETDMKFRDVGAWYHIVWACDSTQADNANRWKIYVNGTQVTLTGNPTITLNGNGIINQWASYDCWIGANARSQQAGNPAQYADVYLSETYFIDGQALDPTSFGEFDADTGIWKPINVSGLTFGNNGFYLDFENSGSLGADQSGNGNNFTVNNLTSIDQTTDTPTNNFATLNPLVKSGSQTYANGNTEIVSIGDNDSVVSSIGTDTMKFYFEVKLSSTYDGSGGGIDVGGLREEQFYSSGFNSGTWSGFNFAYSKFYGNGNDGRFKQGNGNVVLGGLTRAVAGDIVMIAIDPANNRVYAGINGIWLNSSNPVTGTGYIGGTAPTGTGIWFGYHSSDLDKGDCFVNYGNPAFTIASGNSDANGYGNFEYAVPSGYYALCTKNLAEFG